MRRKAGFGLITFLLVCVIGFCSAATVIGKENFQDREREMWYREQEERLLEETKTYLRQEGFANCGVTLTRVIDADGTREYTFTIHHNRIDRMDEEERQTLREELKQMDTDIGMDSGEEKCSFAYEFLLL
jgi:hypothetical protein